MKVLLLFVALAVALYLLLMCIFFVTQRRLLYYPTHVYVPLGEAQADPAFREISVRTRDGIDLKAWYAGATRQPFTIVFFHGNADSIYAAQHVADPYIEAGYGFMLAEYRGYSGLAGSPTEKGLYEDGRAYLGDLMARGIPMSRVILFGHSLGTGVATEMAREFRVGGLMLLAPFLSVPKLASVDFPFFPSTYLALDRFENEKKVGTIGTALLIANGDADQVIPPSQGSALYALALEPKEFRSLRGRGHNDAFDEFAPVALAWLERVPRPN